MGDETPVTSLVLPVLIRPILSQVMMKISVVCGGVCTRQDLISSAQLFYIFQRCLRYMYNWV
jgi:hypothetical protein